VDISRIQSVRRRVIIGTASLFITGSALAGCSAQAETSTPPPISTAPISTTSVSAGQVINISSLMFQPSKTTVKVGTTITWRNDEAITHTVTSGRFEGIDKTTGLRSSQSPDGAFDAKLAKGKTFSFTFTKPGTYTYYCDIHQGMNATITVTPDDATSERNQK
jgi:plastocyanin